MCELFLCLPFAYFCRKAPTALFEETGKMNILKKNQKSEESHYVSAVLLIFEAQSISKHLKACSQLLLIGCIIAIFFTDSLQIYNYFYIIFI